jgi:hypothetical protein
VPGLPITECARPHVPPDRVRRHLLFRLDGDDHRH